MKQPIFIICLFLSLSLQAQRYNLKHALLPAAAAFTAGAAWGTHEAVTHHWPAVHAKFPSLNAQWWNPAESWKNKYFQHDPENARRKMPVQFTDAKHLLVTVHNVCLFSAGVTVTIGEKRPVLHYALDAAVSLAAYTVGNALTYNLIFK